MVVCFSGVFQWCISVVCFSGVSVVCFSGVFQWCVSVVCFSGVFCVLTVAGGVQRGRDPVRSADHQQRGAGGRGRVPVRGNQRGRSRPGQGRPQSGM